MLPPEFHFLRPMWFFALLPLGVLLGLWWQQQRSRHGWTKMIDPALLPHVLIGSQGRGQWPRVLVLALAWLIAVTALAGPSWERREQPVYRQLAARVVVLDLSLSMLSQDISPTRLARAKFKLRDTLMQSREGQTGLVVFAGDAFAITPLTEDVNTLSSQIPVLHPGLLPIQGGRIDRALEQAQVLLDNAKATQAEIFLITDSAPSAAATAQAAKLRAAGHRLAVLGVGTLDGEPIALASGGFLRDNNGAIVIPQLPEDQLQTLAKTGGGPYARIRVDDSDLAHLLRPMQGQLVTPPELDQADAAANMAADKWVDAGVWLTLLVLPLGLLMFRRGMFLVLPLAVLLLQPPPAAAVTWQDFWLRRDQQAQAALEAAQADKAVQLAKDPLRKGSAYYQAKDYESALSEFERFDSATSHYNRGNALAKMGKLQDALAAYDTALEKQPGWAQAQENRQLIEKMLEQQDQQQQNGQNGQQGEQSDQSQSSSGGQSGGESGEQQNQGQPPQNSDLPQASNNPQANPPSDRGEKRGDGPEAEQSQSSQSEQAQSEQAQQNQAAEQNTQQDEDNADQGESSAAAAMSAEQQEQDRALTQWLERVPDDPGGLLREKFRRQHFRMRGEEQEGQNPW